MPGPTPQRSYSLLSLIHIFFFCRLALKRLLPRDRPQPQGVGVGLILNQLATSSPSPGWIPWMNDIYSGGPWRPGWDAQEAVGEIHHDAYEWDLCTGFLKENNKPLIPDDLPNLSRKWMCSEQSCSKHCYKETWSYANLSSCGKHSEGLCGCGTCVPVICKWQVLTQWALHARLSWAPASCYF